MTDLARRLDDDLLDQQWLDERVSAIADGIEAVLDIARNWTEGRCVSRLAPGMSAAEFVLGRVGMLGRTAVPALLQGSSWSQRQIATIAGVSHPTVGKVARELEASFQLSHRQATLGADGKLRSYEERFLRAVLMTTGWDPAPGLMSSISVEWRTPRRIVKAVVEALGGIDLDPCADTSRSIPAGAHYTKDEDGLSRPWHGRVFVNPPYGKPLPAWVAHLVAERKAGRVSAAIALVPARTETDWWASFEARHVCFIHGRLAFSEHHTTAPFPSAAIYLGEESERFEAAFAPLGEVYRRV